MKKSKLNLYIHRECVLTRSVLLKDGFYRLRCCSIVASRSPGELNSFERFGNPDKSAKVHLHCNFRSPAPGSWIFHHVLTPHYFCTFKLFSSMNIKPSNYSEHLWYFLATPLWQFASFLSQSYSYFLKLYNLHNKICTIDHLWYILRPTFRFFFYPTHLKTNNAWGK